MMWETPLSIEQLETVLNSAPVAIYVSALENWELLYANQLARAFLLIKPGKDGITCYQAAGFDAPCPFCHTGEMNREKLCVREFHHPGNGRIYQLSGKLIDWAGRSAHIEYIVDITEKKQEETRARKRKEELQATFSSIPCGLCVYRSDSSGISPMIHNPAFFEIMGYSQEHIHTIERETSFLGVHPEDLNALKEKVNEAIRTDGMVQHVYRVWNDKKGKYHWIRLDCAVKPQLGGFKLLYAVYSDVTSQMQMEQELTAANEKMQDIINAIPGGVAIYKVSDIFETVYFSDGVPELSGYTVAEYQEMVKRDAAEMTYWEDTEMVVARAQEVIQSHGTARFEFRKKHRDGSIVWVRVQIKWIGEENGCPLLHCVFHNITDYKEAELEMDHLINSIPGGIASCRIEGNQLIPTFFSDGVMALSGHNRAEFEAMLREDPLGIIYEPDRKRVVAAGEAAIARGEVLDVSYRTRHKDGTLIWIHLNGRRMGPLSETVKFYAVFTGMSAETRLFQNIANETADGIYVIGRENYDLLYINESKNLFAKGRRCLGHKCYAALHDKSAPCSFCTLKSHKPNGEEHEMDLNTGRFYQTRFWETDWNGIPAYVKYVRDVTEEVKTRREKERLSLYFKTVVENLPGGISVIRCEPDGIMTPEFISDGFAAMTNMSVEEAQNLYDGDIFAGIHPEDAEKNRKKLQEYVKSGSGHCELTGRMRRGNGGYVWIKCTLSLLEATDGIRRLYAMYTDVSQAVSEQEKLRRQYENLIFQHYRTPGPNTLILGHCNITQNRILEIIDYTDSGLLKRFGTVREAFFTGISGFIGDRDERRAFLDTYLNKPAIEAFRQNKNERILVCFVRLPKQERGCYVQFKMDMVETPDTGDITGILTAADITEQTISDRILHQLSVTNYDFVIDLDLEQDRFTVLTCNRNATCVPYQKGCHSERVAYMIQDTVVPKDREQYEKKLEPAYIRERLQRESPYTFAFSVTDENGDIRTKNMTVSAVDLRLGRACMVRTDITDSVREQQGLLNMIAYTFELAGFINISTERLTMYTRRTVLENLSPYVIESYGIAVERFSDRCCAEKNRDEVRRQFSLTHMLEQLEQKPAGYDFVFPYRAGEQFRYKQINVLWGDQNHRTICLVRADVTDILAAERQTKEALEEALSLARESNQAKSEFLSAMSHDIRTPMNAIMGMTALAVAHMDDRERVADCLRKISISSKHLLSLINDILDMSKIERSKISLNRMRIYLPELMDQLSSIMAPQARAAGLEFSMLSQNISHPYFYGDSLRINQILINILSNAVKFTPAGGRVDFVLEEIPPVRNPECCRYRFTVRDSGIGMTEEFLAHIFDPFTRSRDAARIEGTGLGLSITKGLIDLMEGTISVESKAGDGSVFCIELEGEPTTADDIPALEAGESRSYSLDGEKMFTGRRFLVAEDNAMNAEILCEFLQMQGAESVVKSDGRQAVQALQEAVPGTYDAILMDIQMPVMNGYEATRVIRELEPDRGGCIPIIAMTANAFAEDVQASLDAGMTAHVAKPIDVDVLWTTISQVLNGGAKRRLTTDKKDSIQPAESDSRRSE